VFVSGITRVLHSWKYIDFIDDREKCTFTAIIHRKFIDEYKTSIDKINDNIIHSRPLKTVAGRANPNFKIFS